MQTAVMERLGDGYMAVDESATVTGRAIPPALVGAGAEIAAGAQVGSLVVLGDGVRVGRGLDRRARRGPAGRRRSATHCVVRDCIVAAGAVIGDRTHVIGWRGAGRRCHDRGRQRRDAGRPDLPGGRDPGRRAEVLMSGSVDTDALSSAAVDAVDEAGLLADILDLPEHLRDAHVAGRVGQPAAVGLARRPGRRGHGRLGAGRRAGPRLPGRPGLAADPGHARLRPAAVDDARDDRPVLLATRATPRRRWPASRRPACSAPAASW